MAMNTDGALVASVNTNSLPLFAADGTMLRIAFKNDTMFLTIIPKVPDPNGGKPRWPKELGHTANIRPNVAAALYEGFKEKMLPDVEAKRDHEGYLVVATNREATNLCGFTYVGGQAIFSIFNNVGADRTCNEIYSFVFDPTVVIDKYNSATGAYEVCELQGQLFVLLHALCTWYELSSNVVGHNVKNASAWANDRLISYLTAIATKLGAVPAQYGSYRGSSGSYANDGPNFNAQSGSNDGVSWQTGAAAEASVGHTSPSAVNVQQVSSLDALMGGEIPSNNDLPF